MTLRHWVLIRFPHFHHPCADAVTGGVPDTWTWSPSVMNPPTSEAVISEAA
jgi:hypothetical protein